MSCRLCDSQPEPGTDLCGYHGELMEEADPNLCRTCLAPRGVHIRRLKANPLHWVLFEGKNRNTSTTLEQPVKVVLHNDGLCGACHYTARFNANRKCNITGCKFEPLPDNTRCAYHLEDRRKHQAARRAKKYRNGECRECTEKRLPGHVFCKVHLQGKRVSQ